MTRVRIGDRIVDSDRHEIIGPDGPLEFEPQVFDVACYLIQSGGELVTKEQLLDDVWGDRFVSESALTTRIKEARRLLGDDGRAQWAIKTVHGRGYRFVAEVIVADSEADVAVPAMADAAQLPRQLSSLMTTTLVGRIDELAVVDAFTAASSDVGRWVWLLGEPGIGKSRLAAHIAAHAFDGGSSVLFGRCNEDLAVPYQPFIEAIRLATADLQGAALEAALGSRASDLWRLVPDLVDRFAGEVPVGTDPASEQYRLFDAVAAWLDHLGAVQPICVVFDDLHWATESTLQLLGHLRGVGLRSSVTFVITTRDTAPDLQPALSDMVAAVAGDPAQLVVRLDGLDAAAIAQLDLGADATALQRQTAGNPLLLQSMGGSGARLDVDDAVRRRLSNLGSDVQESLAVAAVIGLDFELRVLAEAVGRDEMETLDMLEDAVACRLLSEIGVDRFSFDHALIRSALRDRLSAGRRSRWHGRIAEAIEACHGVGADDQLQAIAHHYAEASLSQPALRPIAVQRLRDAARSASAQLSFLEAAAQLERARGLAESDDRRLIAELTLEQGEAETFAGQSMLAMGSFESAFADAEAVGDVDLLVRAALDFEDVTWRPGRHGGPAVDRLRKALAVIEPAQVRERARLLGALSRALSLTGDRDGLAATSAEAEELALQLGDPELEARVLTTRLSDVGDEGLPMLQSADIDRLEQLLAQILDWELRLLAFQVVQRERARSGEFERFRTGHVAFGRLVDGTRSPFWKYVWTNADAMLELLDGDLAAAESRSERCLEIAQDMPGEDPSGTFGLRMFVVRREQDRLRALAPIVRQLVSTNDSESFWRPGLALMLAETGATDEAAELLAEFRRADFRSPPDALWTTLMVLMIELAVGLEDADSCERLQRRFAAQEGTMIVTGHGILCLGSADRYLGMLAHSLGDHREAERLFRAAVEQDDRCGSPLWAGHDRLWLGRTCAARGAEDEARYVLNQIKDQVDGRGFARLEREVDETIEGLD